VICICGETRCSGGVACDDRTVARARTRALSYNGHARARLLYVADGIEYERYGAHVVAWRYESAQ
jgi:hypothetical protein